MLVLLRVVNSESFNEPEGGRGNLGGAAGTALFQSANDGLGGDAIPSPDHRIRNVYCALRVAAT